MGKIPFFQPDQGEARGEPSRRTCQRQEVWEKEEASKAAGRRRTERETRTGAKKHGEGAMPKSMDQVKQRRRSLNPSRSNVAVSAGDAQITVPVSG